MATAWTATARKRHLCHGIGHCIGTGSIEPGQDYARHVAFGDEDFYQGDRPWVMRLCAPCQTQYDRPMPPRRSRRRRETEIRRPNGKLYRPRKAPEAQYVGSDDWPPRESVFVLRTHDVAAHQEWAENLFRSQAGDDVPLHGVATWVRLVPWDDCGHGGDSTWLTDQNGDDVRTIPAVIYEPVTS